MCYTILKKKNNTIGDDMDQRQEQLVKEFEQCKTSYMQKMSEMWESFLPTIKKIQEEQGTEEALTFLINSKIPDCINKQIAISALFVALNKEKCANSKLLKTSSWPDFVIYSIQFKNSKELRKALNILNNNECLSIGYADNLIVFETESEREQFAKKLDGIQYKILE